MMWQRFEERLDWGARKIRAPALKRYHGFANESIEPGAINRGICHFGRDAQPVRPSCIDMDLGESK